MVWELHESEDRRRREEERRTGEQEDRTFQHCTPCSTLPEPPGPAGTGISSAAARAGDRRSQCGCWGGGTGVPGGVGTGVSAQPVTVPDSVMGTSISSATAYAGQALKGTVGTGGPGGAQGQDWRSRCCAVGGDGAVPVGTILLAGVDVTWEGWGGGGR